MAGETKAVSTANAKPKKQLANAGLCVQMYQIALATTEMELADTVSEVKNVKHAFDAGIKAQKGIDW